MERKSNSKEYLWCWLLNLNLADESSSSPVAPGSEWMAGADSFLIPGWFEAGRGSSQRNKARPVRGLVLQITLSINLET
jgi:hypothetical protein